jgi:hypothetical protein
MEMKIFSFSILRAKLERYAQAQSQSSHSHGCDPEACMLLVCGHETKLGYYCLSSKISFGAKSRVRYVPISLCKEPKVTRNWTYALAYAKVTRIWIFRTSTDLGIVPVRCLVARSSSAPLSCDCVLCVGCACLGEPVSG